MMGDLLDKFFIVTTIQKLIDTGNIGDFIEYGREKAKKDGMDTENLMAFFDELENEFCDNINWVKVKDITQKVTGCKVKTFKGDKSLIIENEEMSDDECKDYLAGEMEGKVNLEHINQGLKVANVKLEFIEAMLLPFDADGFQNIVRFKVVELDK